MRPLLSKRLSYFIFAAWQVVVLATAGGILAGQAQAVEWGETPNVVSPNGSWLFPIDTLVMVGLVLVAIQFLSPIFNRRKDRRARESDRDPRPQEAAQRVAGAAEEVRAAEVGLSADPSGRGHEVPVLAPGNERRRVGPVCRIDGSPPRPTAGPGG